MRSLIVRNFTHVFLAYAKFYAHEVETKVIKNVTSNIFGDHTFPPRECYFRVIAVNVKFRQVCQSKWSPFCTSGQFYLLGACQKIFLSMSSLWKVMFPRIGKGRGGGRRTPTPILLIPDHRVQKITNLGGCEPDKKATLRFQDSYDLNKDSKKWKFSNPKLPKITRQDSGGALKFQKLQLWNHIPHFTFPPPGQILINTNSQVSLSYTLEIRSSNIYEPITRATIHRTFSPTYTVYTE